MAEVQENSAAMEAGLRAGDRVLRIGTVAISEGVGLEEVNQMVLKAATEVSSVVQSDKGLMDELKTFSAENKIEPDEWTEPVIIFNKQAHAENNQTQGQKKPKFKPRLQIGVDDGEKSAPACHLPQQLPDARPPPQQAPPQQSKP